MDMIFLESVINGLLLGGVFALLTLGLNLVFGVTDVIWLCYAEMVMLGMYVVYFVYNQLGAPLWVAFVCGVIAVSLSGVVLHRWIIEPVLSAPPINQLLVTGGVLFFLQSLATLLFTTEFKNLGLKVPVLEVSELFINLPRLGAFVLALLGAGILFLFLTKTRLGTAIRAVSQDREVLQLMGIDTRRVYLITAGIGGALAGAGGCLLAVQSDIHPFVGLSFGTLSFMICVMGGLGSMIGGFLAAFVMGLIISIGGVYGSIESSYVLAFAVFIVFLFIRPQGFFGKRV